MKNDIRIRFERGLAVCLVTALGISSFALESRAQSISPAPEQISGYATRVVEDGVNFEQSRTYLRVQSNGKGIDFELPAGAQQGSGYITLDRSKAVNDSNALRSSQFGNAQYQISSFTADPTAAAHAPTTGTINVLVLVWPSATNVVSTAELEDRLNGLGSNSVRSFISSSSQGRTSMSFTVRYLQGDGPRCFDLNESQDALNRLEAQEPNIDLGKFQTLAMLFSENSCDGSAAGMAGGAIAFTSKRGTVYMSQFAMVFPSDANPFHYIFRHELGHTLGLGHASTESCANNVFDSGCVNWNYADTSNVMGSVGLTFQDYHRWQMGWIDALAVVSRNQLQLGPDVKSSPSVGLIEIPSPYKFALDIAKPWLLIERQVSPASTTRTAPKLVLKLASSSNIGTMTLYDQSRPFGAEPLVLEQIGDVIELPGLGLSLQVIENSIGRSSILVTNLAAPTPIFSSVYASNAAAQGLIDGRCTDRTLDFNGNWPDANVRFVDLRPDRFEHTSNATVSILNGHFKARLNSVDPTIQGYFAVSTSASTVREYYQNLNSPDVLCNERPLAATVTVTPAAFSTTPSCQNTAVNIAITGLSGYNPFFGNTLLSATPGTYLQSFSRDTRLPFLANLQVQRPVETIVLGQAYDPPRYCPSAGLVPTFNLSASWNKKCTAIQVTNSTANPVNSDPVQLTLYKKMPLRTILSATSVPQGGGVLLPFNATGPAFIYAFWNGQVRTVYLDQCVL
jgi:hypothetical protein